MISTDNTIVVWYINKQGGTYSQLMHRGLEDPQMVPKTPFGNQVAKGNSEAKQQRFLATSSVATTMQQQQKVTYPAPPTF